MNRVGAGPGLTDPAQPSATAHIKSPYENPHLGFERANFRMHAKDRSKTFIFNPPTERTLNKCGFSLSMYI